MINRMLNKLSFCRAYPQKKAAARTEQTFAIISGTLAAFKISRSLKSSFRSVRLLHGEMSKGHTAALWRWVQEADTDHQNELKREWVMHFWARGPLLVSEENLNTLESADIPTFFEGFPPLLFPGLSFVFRLSEPGLLVNFTWYALRMQCINYSKIFQIVVFKNGYRARAIRRLMYDGRCDERLKITCSFFPSLRFPSTTLSPTDHHNSFF